MLVTSLLALLLVLQDYNVPFNPPASSVDTACEDCAWCFSFENDTPPNTGADYTPDTGAGELSTGEDDGTLTFVSEMDASVTEAVKIGTYGAYTDSDANASDALVPISSGATETGWLSLGQTSFWWKFGVGASTCPDGVIFWTGRVGTTPRIKTEIDTTSGFDVLISISDGTDTASTTCDLNLSEDTWYFVWVQWDVTTLNGIRLRVYNDAGTQVGSTCEATNASLDAMPANTDDWGFGWVTGGTWASGSECFTYIDSYKQATTLDDNLYDLRNVETCP